MGQITARAVRVSRNADGVVISTVECALPRIILAHFLNYPELVVSTALHDDCEDCGTAPVQIETSAKVSPFVLNRLIAEFQSYKNEAVAFVSRLRDLYPEFPGNAAVRHILYPFTYVRVLITATEWTRFFDTTLKHVAFYTPMKLVAEAIHDALAAAPVHDVPEGGAHIPYIVDEDLEAVAEFVAKDDRGMVSQAQLAFATMLLRKISVARCCRVSGVNGRGERPCVKQDLNLYESLVAEQMLVPAAHVALPDRVVDLSEHGGPQLAWIDEVEHERYVGWRPYSRFLKGRHEPQDQSKQGVAA